MSGSQSTVLTLNVGSSSLKFGIYAGSASPKLILRGKVTQIGLATPALEIDDASGARLLAERVKAPDHQAALQLVLEKLGHRKDIGQITAVGHRVVQGGPHHYKPELVTPELLAELRALCPQDPPHLPAAIKGIEAAQKLGPSVRQVACFDTAFHRTLPRVAQQVALPSKLTEETGIIRYGFHGLSCEFIVGELERMLGRSKADGKVIIAHLGNGASMTALTSGRSVETTMGFTPAGGLVMGSRLGDLDPGVLAYLLREQKVTVEGLNELIYQQSGMKGVSDLSSDMQQLLAEMDHNWRAAEAVELFCYQARKALGALVAVLDGLDLLVFTGGIGEHSPLPRARICKGLGHMDLRIDAARNEANDRTISTPESTIAVYVIPTDEEMVIARQTAALCFS